MEFLHSKLIKFRNSFLTVFGNIHLNKYFTWLPYYKPTSYKIKGTQTRQLMSIVKPGDVMLRGYDDYVDGLFIGKWSHAALVLNETEVIHSMSQGVFKQDLLDFYRTDRICILRPNLNEEELKQVLLKAESMEGMPYDFGFTFDNHPKEVYCSEFVYVSFEDFAEKLGMYKPTEKVFGKQKIVVRPGIFLSFGGFEKKYEFS
jgi:hypothetical protein